VFFRLVAEASFDWILVEIVATDVVVGGVADAVVGKASLPDGEFGREPVGEATFDELHRSFEGDVGWSDDEVEMVGHDDVGMQKIAGAVVVDGFEEERGVAFNLEETAAVVGGCGDEVSARSGGAARDRHSAIVKRTSAAEQVAENAVLLKHGWSPRP
jgi:hypothetical protein